MSAEPSLQERRAVDAVSAERRPDAAPYYLPLADEVDVFLAAYSARLPVLLKGPTGCGKTRFVEHMAHLLYRGERANARRRSIELPLVTVACHEDLAASDLVGRYLLTGDETVWIDGPLTRAVRTGALCYLDEIVEARKDTTVLIHPLTDHRRTLPIEKRATILDAHEDFLLVISYNPGYQSVLKDLKPSTRQRFVSLEFDYPPPEIETRIIAHEGGVDLEMAADLATLGQKVRSLREHGFEEGASTRLLVYTAQLVAQGIDVQRACEVAISRAITDDREVQRAVAELVTTIFPVSAATGDADHPTAAAHIASFRESRRILELYAEAIAGRHVELRTTDDLPDLSAHVRRDLPTSSARCVFLPATVEYFATARDNFAVYKLAILHQLGFWDCGTYSFSLASAPPPAADEARSDLATFFDSFARPALARQLWSVLEDTRIDAHLWRRYRGMRRALATLFAASLEQRPPLALLGGDRARLEALVQLSLSDPAAPSSLPPLPTLTGALPILRRAIDAVRDPEASVYTTAEQVESCIALFGPPTRDDARGATLRPLRRAPSPGTKPEPISVRANAKRSVVAAGTGDDESAAASVEPVPFRGAARPELVQKELRLEELESRLGDVRADGAPIPPEVLRRMLERGEIEIEAGERRALDESSGLSATDLPGLADRLRDGLRQRLSNAIRSLSGELEGELGDLAPRHGVHYYDEWDHERARYRRAWCRLTETRLDAAETTELDAVRAEQAELFSAVRRQFELLRPDARRILKRLADGEDIDLDAAVEAHADRMAGTSPSEQVYMRRDRRDREVAAAFLLDMSASTDSEVEEEKKHVEKPTAKDYDYVGIYDDDLWGPTRSGKPARRRRVIDVEKEALLLMTEALDALGDAYGVYGFSGYGREQVEFYVAKDFAESGDRRALERIAAIKPKRSTRMGPAIRHATRKLRAQEARVRVLLVLSDGYPQDFDYGRDRTSRTYGIQDTMMALREAELQGIHTFCLTVDPAGHDYLREMCPERQYLVIDDVASLPRELPKVYRGLTT